MVGVRGGRGLSTQLVAPPRDPSVMIVRGPSTPVFGAVGFGSPDELLGLSHFRSVDQLLELGPSGPQPLLVHQRQRRGLFTARRADRARLLRGPECPFDRPQLV